MFKIVLQPINRNLMFKALTVCFIFLSLQTVAQQQKHTISGTVRNKKTGESIIGATIRASKQQVATSNEYGFYSLTMPDGKYTLEITLDRKSVV